MINQELLRKIESAINLRPCDACGRQHHLKLRQNSIHSSASSSTVGILFPNGDDVFVEFSSDSCDEFKSRVRSFVLSKAESLVQLPFEVM